MGDRGDGAEGGESEGSERAGGKGGEKAQSMNTTLTILGGLTLLVIGQIVIRSVIDPIYDIRKLRGKIANALIYYERFYMTPTTHKTPEEKEALNAIRSLGAQLEVNSYALPFYRFFAFIRAVPNMDSIIKAGSNLWGLSNSLDSGNVENSKRNRQAIIEALNLRGVG